MRKKSHIALAKYLADSEGMSLLTAHKGAFCWGSILPDCVPSFVTRRHCISDTFFILKKELTLLIEHYDYSKGITGYFCRHLGIILHHVADFFTYPHNSFYEGNLKQHCSYEEELKQYLKHYVSLPSARKQRNAITEHCTVEHLCNTILHTHKQYAVGEHSIAHDTSFIIKICHYIVDHILAFAEQMICVPVAAAS